MREIRIYQPGVYASGQSVVLSPEATHHVAVVLRMQVGAPLTLFCGDNQEYAAEILSITKKQVLVEIGAITPQNRESPLSIHLAQAISKGDRMEFVVQKAVELGVASITPIISARCAVKRDKERMEKKHHQWRQIIIAACEQSGRNTVPELFPACAFDEYLTQVHTGHRFMLHPTGGKTWREYPLKDKNTTILIGPEGGLSDEEVQSACQHGFLPLSLGPRILRTETATITALSVLQAVGGDL